MRFPGREPLFFLLLLTLMVPFQVNLIPLYKMMSELHKIFPPLGADTYSGIIIPSATFHRSRSSKRTSGRNTRKK